MIVWPTAPVSTVPLIVTVAGPSPGVKLIVPSLDWAPPASGCEPIARLASLTDVPPLSLPGKISVGVALPMLIVSVVVDALPSPSLSV